MNLRKTRNDKWRITGCDTCFISTGFFLPEYKLETCLTCNAVYNGFYSKEAKK
jgi:hypothetical protein